MKELVEVQTVRNHIALVFQAREAHALVVSQKDTSVRELSEVMEERTRVKDRLTAREREIALAGGELPEEAFPEDAELFRLDRHVRIRQECVRNWESKIRESQGQLNLRIGELEASWIALGTAISERLAKEFQEAALALKDVHLRYFALRFHFHGEWSPAAWKFFDKKLYVANPVKYELIIDPLRSQLANKWPASVHTLLKDVESLRAEIDAVKS